MAISFVGFTLCPPFGLQLAPSTARQGAPDEGELARALRTVALRGEVMVTLADSRVRQQLQWWLEGTRASQVSNVLV